MKKWFFPAFLLFITTSAIAQPVTQQLQKAFQQFENDVQLKHAMSSLYVIDALTGQVVFDKNSQVGLAPASTQKIITSVTAFELLGKDYRFMTVVNNNGKKILITGFGDPTFGSWRYNRTKDTAIFESIIAALKQKGISSFEQLEVNYNRLGSLPPSGWINEDIGNYYGAAAQEFNWHENQFELTFIPGKKAGEPTELDTIRSGKWMDIDNYCMTGAPGSGDNAYLYFIPGSKNMVVKGTVPAGVSRFSISGTDAMPGSTFGSAFLKYCSAKNIYKGDGKPSLVQLQDWDFSLLKGATYVHYSPPLDSVIYWFNKKSINLYGEALVKAFAYEQQGFGRTDSGISIVRRFWEQKGIDREELNMRDGSGLSPLNRVTTHAQVEILKYARGKDWYPYFYDALPEYNGMKMKSGTISDAKAFCGYHKATNGKEYIFSFLVNNYSGRSAELVRKMYQVLDVLK